MVATPVVKCSYEEIIDLHTEHDKATVLGIHTPTGDTPRRLFKGFFDQYRKYRYLGCSIAFYPIATLPADPLQVGYEGGQQIAPQDLVNPIMFHGCHGEDLGVILNQLYGSNKEISDGIDGIDSAFRDTNLFQTATDDLLVSLYYKALTDKTWRKAHPQRGFKKSGLRPLVYNVVSNHQIMPGIGLNDDGQFETDQVTPSMEDLELLELPLDEVRGNLATGNSRDLKLMTNRLTRLGWLDTRSVLTDPSDDAETRFTTWMAENPIVEGETYGHYFKRAAAAIDTTRVKYTELEKIFMGVILLSPSILTEMHFRVIINHYFAFKGFRGISLQTNVLDVPSYRNVEDYEDLFDPDEGRVPGGAGKSEEPVPPEPDQYRNVSVLIQNNASYGALRWIISFNGTPVYTGTVSEGVNGTHNIDAVKVGTLVQVSWMDDETILPAGDAYPQEGIIVESGGSTQSMIFKVVNS